MITCAPPIDADQLRLRHEFLSLPGLVLTVPQVARLLDVRAGQAEELLAELEAEGFLMHLRPGTYRRVDPSMA